MDPQSRKLILTALCKPFTKCQLSYRPELRELISSPNSGAKVWPLFLTPASDFRKLSCGGIDGKTRMGNKSCADLYIDRDSMRRRCTILAAVLSSQEFSCERNHTGGAVRSLFSCGHRA